MTGLRAPRGRRAGADERRGERITKVLQLVERFVYDLGLLIAGQVVDLSNYVAAAAAERLRAAVQPALARGVVTQPDFGEYAQVSIEGDLLDLTTPVRTVVEFDDRSRRVDEHGAGQARPRRRVRLLLLLDPAITVVLDHRIEIV